MEAVLAYRAMACNNVGDFQYRMRDPKVDESRQRPARQAWARGCARLGQDLFLRSGGRGRDANEITIRLAAVRRECSRMLRRSRAETMLADSRINSRLFKSSNRVWLQLAHHLR
jgi:hypothetical protein